MCIYFWDGDWGQYSPGGNLAVHQRLSGMGTGGDPGGSLACVIWDVIMAIWHGLSKMQLWQFGMGYLKCGYDNWAWVIWMKLWQFGLGYLGCCSGNLAWAIWDVVLAIWHGLSGM